MISEFNPSTKLDTNSLTTEDRHLFVHKSLYTVGLQEDWLDSRKDSPTSSPYTFWAGKTLRNKDNNCFFPSVTQSKFSYFLGNKKQKERKTAQTENEEMVNKNPQPAGFCERAWGPFTDTVPGFVQGRQQKLLDWKAGLAEETHFLFSLEQGHISIQSVSPQQF